MTNRDWRTFLDRTTTVLLTLLRFLLGAMFAIAGTTWLRRADAGAYLRDAIEVSLATHGVPGYEAFLREVVLAWPGLFAFLVGAGELAVGIALLAGFPPRLGALGGAFLTANYGLAFSKLFPPGGNFVLMMLLLVLTTERPYRRLVLRWPGSNSSED